MSSSFGNFKRWSCFRSGFIRKTIRAISFFEWRVAIPIQYGEPPLVSLHWSASYSDAQSQINSRSYRRMAVDRASRCLVEARSMIYSVWCLCMLFVSVRSFSSRVYFRVRVLNKREKKSNFTDRGLEFQRYLFAVWRMASHSMDDV